MARSFGVDPQWKEEKYDSSDDDNADGMTTGRVNNHYLLYNNDVGMQHAGSMPLTKQEEGGSGSADQEPEAGIWEMGNLMENSTFCA